MSTSATPGMLDPAALLDACESGMIVLDASGRVLHWNAWLARRSGVDFERAAGRTLSEIFGRGLDKTLERAIAQALESGMSSVLSPRLHLPPMPLYRNAQDRASGRLMYQMTSVKAMGLERETRQCVIQVTDMTASVVRERELVEQAQALRKTTEELRSAEARVRHLAFHDPLTGLPNRALFHDRLEMHCEQARRRKGRFAVMLVDLDRFKSVNDSFGHVAGDELIRSAARRLEACLRASDTVARLGGDEFAVIQTDLSDVSGAESLAGKIATALCAPVMVAGATMQPSASIGVSIFGVDADEPKALVNNADRAMYHAKREGRGSWRLYSQALEAAPAQREALERGFRRALRDRHLAVHYQPQVSLRSHRLLALEALVRWMPPDEPVIYPGDFVPMAEETGLITELGDFVLDEVCRACHDWDSGVQRMPGVAVNLSPKQFRDPHLVDKLVRAQQALGGRDGCRLELELTEGVLVEDVDRAESILDILSGHGISLVIDDFGAGYSSLGYLRRFPVRKLKIDKSFIQELQRDGNDAVIANAVIGLGHSLGHIVIAEGVETASQADLLKALGCDGVQGYYFGRPMPIGDVRRMAAGVSPLFRDPADRRSA
jgi:diguanylate cyclase (GGDEF)-like protein